MPYIYKNHRERLNHSIRELSLKITSIGEINYVITNLLLDYLVELDENYKTYNEIIGVLECIKQEFYRRQIAPFESSKAKINGDVY